MKRQKRNFLIKEMKKAQGKNKQRIKSMLFKHAFLTSLTELKECSNFINVRRALKYARRCAIPQKNILYKKIKSFSFLVNKEKKELTRYLYLTNSELNILHQLGKR